MHERVNDDRVSMHTWHLSATTWKEMEEEGRKSYLQERRKTRDLREKVKEYNGALGKLNFKNPFTDDIKDTRIPMGLKV